MVARRLTFLEESGEESGEPGLKPLDMYHCSKKKREGLFFGFREKLEMITRWETG